LVKALVAQVPVPLLSETSTILSINHASPSLVFKILIVAFNKKLDTTRKQGPFEKVIPEYAQYI